MRERARIAVTVIIIICFAYIAYTLYTSDLAQSLIQGHIVVSTNNNITLAMDSLIPMIAILVLMRARTALRPPDTTYGDAHFANTSEIKHAGFIANDQSLILGKIKHNTVGIPKYKQYEHTLLIAPTGAGKTTSIIIPGLLTENGHRGIFVNDIKRELYDKTAGALSKYMPVSLFSPTKPAESVHYNPLDFIATMEDAEDLAACWVDNTGVSSEPYYNDSARLLITAAVLHIVDTEPRAPFSQLADLLSSTTFDQIRTVLTKTTSQRAKSVGLAFINSVGTDPKRAGGIMSGMATRFFPIKNPDIRTVTSKHPKPEKNINFKRIAETPEALFLSVPASDARRLKPLTSLLVMQMMNYLAKRESSNRKPFVMYMDELANIGKVPHYPEHISLVRGQEIALIQVIQNFSQLNAVYGKEDAQTIISNSNTKIFFSGMSKTECEYASELLGTATITVRSTSVSNRESKSFLGEKSYTTSNTSRERLLMKPDEVRQLGRGNIIVVCSNLTPMLIHSKPYYEQKELAGLVDLPIEP